jgi:hypothetical protein
MEARLPEEKLSYLRTLLLEWLARRSCSLHDLQHLVGFLQFCSQVIPHSRAFLRRLINFSTTFKSRHAIRHIPAYARAEIRWWLVYTWKWNGVCLITPPRETVHVYTDESGKKGIGGIFENEWFSSRVPSDSASGIFSSKRYTQSSRPSFAGGTAGSRSALSFMSTTKSTSGPSKMTRTDLCM